VQTISEWLKSIGLSEYAQRFVENYVDPGVLPDLTDQDLRELGIPLGHRKKLLRAIAQLQGTPAGKLQPTEEVGRERAELRQLTVMFSDLVGSTALSARLDPEDMRRVLALFQRRIGEVISEHHGTVARYMGDGVLAYFGYPQAHEDDAEEAVRAGLALVDAVARLRTEADSSLQVRVGIATGTVIVGDLLIGAGGEEWQAVGETPNLAARLQSLAEPSTVVICARTRRLVAGHFECRDLGPVALKGWTETIPAWQAVRTSGVISRFDARHTTALPPLVGRDEEIALLWRRWQYAAEGEGRVTVVTGEPGIGKSHIALALADRIKSEPHITLRYFCSAHHSNSTLFPFIDQLERAAGFARGDSPADRFAKLENLVMPSAVERGQAIGLLANLLSLQPGERYLLPELTPQSRKEKTLAALWAQLEALAAKQPVLVIFEDVHWIDASSLELLTLAVERLSHHRVLLLVTARPEFIPPWPEHAHVTTIALTRLGPASRAAIIERITGGKALPEEVMNQILARTEGVPLFIEELTKTVLESGLLREQDGHYVLEHSMPSLAIPTTLHASLMARLDRLAPVREVAQIGAVIGREFSYELVNNIARLPRQELEHALSQLIRSDLIFRRGEIPQAVYSFKHILVREAAYTSLLKTRRMELHAAIASTFEQGFSEVADRHPEMVAHHLTEAGLNEKAVGYWLKAGKNAAQRFANLEAIANLQRGIEIASRLPDCSVRDRLELDLQFALGPCLIATQGPASNKAIATFARARELCIRLGDAPEYLQVMFWIATGSVIRGELPRAQEATATLLDLAKARNNRPMLINAMRGLGMILLFMGQIEDARKLTEQAVKAFAASTEPEQLAARAAGQDAGAAGLALLSWALWILGEVDTAAARMAAALQRADEVKHPHTQAYVCYYASILHGLRGEPAVARHYAERCLGLSDQHGFHHWRGLSRAIRGICITVLDPSCSMIEEVTSALREYSSAGYRLGITALYVLLCPALLLGKQSAAALQIAEQGLSIANHNSERIFEAELSRLKAQALLASGAPGVESQAYSLLNEALMTARRQRARSLELRAATDLAGLLSRRGKCDEALTLIAPVYAGFTEGFETQDLKAGRCMLERLQARGLQ
jgi:predicted ATPase/class 3 adenylate cyclase